MDRRKKNHIATEKRSSGARRRKKSKKRANPVSRVAIGTLAVLCVIMLGLIVFSNPPRSDKPAMNVAASAAPGETDRRADALSGLFPDAATALPAQDDMQAVIPETTQAPTAVPTPTPTPTPEPTATPAPTPFEYLPVYKHGDTLEPKIAITVDDCFQLENLREIIQLANANGGKLTIFPIGENISIPGMADTLKEAVFQLGYEVENHTWSHARIFRLPESEMAAEIWKQSQALNQALGVNYEQHFLRLMGGDGSSDQRIHNYLEQLGYKGIAEWSLSGSDADLNWIKSALQPGAIYLFHSTDADTAKLREFIPWVRAQGYQMVTMNELLGLEDNATSPLAPSAMPEPRSYTPDYRTHKKGDYAWIIVQMQDALRQMGYLVMDGPSTGYYGDQTAAAVKAYQQDHGLPVTGEADAETQKMLLGVEA